MDPKSNLLAQKLTFQVSPSSDMGILQELHERKRSRPHSVCNAPWDKFWWRVLVDLF